MKVSEIVPGLAYAWQVRAWEKPRRVVVLSTGVTRNNGRYGRQDERKDGVEIRTEAGAECVVASREVRELWESHEARDAAHNARVQKERERREQEDAINASVIAALSSVGVTAARGAGWGVIIADAERSKLIDVCRDAMRWRIKHGKVTL